MGLYIIVPCDTWQLDVLEFIYYKQHVELSI